MKDLGGRTYQIATAVSGNIVVGSGLYEAFFRDLRATSPRLRFLGTLGGRSSGSSAIDGTVTVGESDTADGETHAFAADVRGTPPTMLDLGTLGGRNSSARDVAGSRVVGSAQTAAGDFHATAWTLALRGGTATTLTSSVNPSVVGGQVTLTAGVRPTPDGGMVRFTDGGGTITGCASRPVNPATGVAVCAATYDRPGTHEIRAMYSGHLLFAPSASSVLTQQVGYDVRALYDGSKPHQSGSTVQIRVLIGDVDGRNLSAQSIPVSVTALTPDPAPGLAPTGAFRFTSGGPEGPAYRFAVKTARYPPGAYTIWFAISGDPVSHRTHFMLK